MREAVDGPTPGSIPADRRSTSWRTARWVALATTIASAGCATAPTDQIKYFSQAFNSVNTLGQPLLDDLAVAERKQGQGVAETRARKVKKEGSAFTGDCPYPWFDASGNPGVIAGFCSKDAPYFSVLDDPPATAALRGALGVIEKYADVLSMLAEGRNVEGAIGQISALRSNVTGLLEVVGLAGAAAAPIAPALTALEPILEAAAKQSNAVEAKRLILTGAPAVSKLIKALRDSSPAIFDTLTESSLAQLSTEAAQNASFREAQVTRVNAYRVTVSNYIVLLGKMQSAWDRTVAAATAPPSALTLASLVQQTSELQADAEAARKAFAILRTGASPAPPK